MFFTNLYRSPYTHGTQQFETFLTNFVTLYENIKNENLYVVFFPGDCNGHSQLWWHQGDINAEGREMEQLTSLLGLKQLINEPNKNPICIDLIFTGQPNCIIESGTKPSLENLYHHQITFCCVNVK